MPEKQSPFSLVSFLVEEAHITRKPIKKDPRLKIEIEPSGLINETTGSFQMNLLVSVIDENDTFSAQINAVGLFSFKKVKEKENLSSYFYVNAPAIIFPYIRSYIAALTALSGMPSVNLPLMNLGKMVKSLKDNTRTI